MSTRPREFGDIAALEETHAILREDARTRDRTRPATASQVRALNAIAEKQQLDLAELLHGQFGIAEPAHLTITEASRLIDQLNAQASNGQGANP